MTTTQNDDTKVSENELQSSEKGDSQKIKAFMAFNTPKSSLLDTSDSRSENKGDDEEDEETYDAQDAFNDLFIQSVELENKNKQLKRKINDN